jgi:DNA-binding NtrC family response regulator
MADAPGSAGPFDPNETGTGMTTLFEGDWATVRRLRKGKLVVVSGADQGKSVEIAKPRVTGGRSIISDLVVQDKAVSGTHFEVSARDDGYRLRDLNSRNGIFVGELRIREVFLRPGTVFRIGHTNIQFQTLEDVVEIELSKKDRFDAMLGASPAMREIFAHLEKVAPSDLTCMITGETGTGKEMVARALHNASGRKSKPFVVLDCGSIPRELIESTLFGHEKGSFTGAVAQHVGCFEQATGGTIFLDEIGELDIMLQPKLLRVLEQRELRRVGGSKVIKVDLRVIAATRKDLRSEVEKGKFREDLYFRLNVVPITAPALRERREDIPLLIDAMLGKLAPGGGIALSDATRAALMAHDWPGNVRELRNVIERALALGADPGTLVAPLGGEPTARTAQLRDGIEFEPGVSFRDTKDKWNELFERRYLTWLIRRAEGNISKAARDADMDRKYLHKLLRKYGITTAGDTAGDGDDDN